MKALSGPCVLTSCLGLAVVFGLAASTWAGQEAVVARAKAKLAETLRTSPAELELASIEAIDLPASGLQCGPASPAGEGTEDSAWRVQLRRGGRTFDVRVAGDQAVVCLFGSGGAPRVPSVGAEAAQGSIEGGLTEQVERARADLAGRASVASEKIEVLEAASVVWPDASAGCPRPKMNYAQVLTPGARIRLKAKNRVYEYHARLGGLPVFCPNPSPVEPLRAEIE